MKIKRFVCVRPSWKSRPTNNNDDLEIAIGIPLSDHRQHPSSPICFGMDFLTNACNHRLGRSTLTHRSELGLSGISKLDADKKSMDNDQIVFQSRVLGSIRRIKLPGVDSFLGTVGVPTFIDCSVGLGGLSSFMITIFQ